MKPKIKKVLKWVAILVLVCAAGSLVFLKYIGVWNIIFPSHAHETVAPEIPATVEAPVVLLFTKTNSFRYREAIAAGSEFF